MSIVSLVGQPGRLAGCLSPIRKTVALGVGTASISLSQRKRFAQSFFTQLAERSHESLGLAPHMALDLPSPSARGNSVRTDLGPS
jgi:hypothetical protein